MLTEKQRRTIYLQEMELMAQTAKAKMEDAQSVDMAFLRASHIEHVRPMFRVSFSRTLRMRVCSKLDHFARRISYAKNQELT